MLYGKRGKGREQKRIGDKRGRSDKGIELRKRGKGKDRSGGTR